MNNASTSYFKATFELTTESAAAIASLFGRMNLFARGAGQRAHGHAPPPLVADHLPRY